MEQAQAPPAVVPPADKDVPRKIIHTAQLHVLVEDFTAAEAQLRQLVADQKGYVARSDVQGTPGKERTGTWTVRVPVENFDSFLSEVAAVGELQRNSTDSQDVSEEFYDIEARIKNKKVEEDRLVKHLEKSTGKLEEILAVEREISRVRGEIETLQGRMQKLANLTALTTVTITIQERNAYVAPSSPSFGTTIARTFEGSLSALIELGKGILLIAVALTPWLPVLLMGGGLVWFVVRLAGRKGPRSRTPLAPEPAPPPSPG